MLYEGAALRVPAALRDLPVDRVPGRHPADDVGGQSPLAGNAYGALDRHPAHQPGVGELPPAAAHLPESLVGLVPVLVHPVDDLADFLPAVVGNRRAVLVVQVDRVNELAVDVELQPAGAALPTRTGAEAA